MVYLPILFFLSGLAGLFLGIFCPWQPSTDLRRRLLKGTLFVALLLFIGEIADFVVYQSMLLLVLSAFLVGIVYEEPSMDRGTTSWPRLSQVVFCSLVVLIFGLGIYLRFYNLGEYGLRLDERFHYQTALGYVRTGMFHQWNFTTSTPGDPYYRALEFTWLVSQSFRLWGVSLWAGRLVSFFWGLILFIPVLWIGFKLRLNRYWLTILMLFTALYPFAITISRWMRLYSMFAVLFLGTTVLLYEFIHSREWSRRIWTGFLLFVIGALAVETHLLTLTLILSVLCFLLGEKILVRDGFHLVEKTTGTIVIMFLLVLVFASLFGLSNSIYREINEGIRVSSSYPAALYEQVFGYGLGSLILLITFLLTRRDPFERYLWWVILPPIMMLVFATDRFYQFRYAGHLSLLCLPLFILTGQRLVYCARKLGSRSLMVGIAVVFLIMPLVDLRSELDYIFAGNMGYVHFQGVESPKYRPLLNKMTPLLNSRHHVVTLHINSKYRHDFRQTGARVSGISSPVESKIVEELKPYHGHTQVRHQWLIIPVHAEESFHDSFYRRIEERFELLFNPERFEMFVFHRRVKTDKN